MRKVIFLFVVAFLNASANADEGKLVKATSAFVEAEAEISPHEVRPIIKGGMTHFFNYSIGFSAFLLGTNDWFQAYGGIVCNLRYFKITISAGIEQIGKGNVGPRMAVSVETDVPYVHIYGLVEMSGSGEAGDYSRLWYDLNFLLKPSKYLSFGFKDRRSLGFGPQIQITIPKFIGFSLVWAPVAAEKIEIDPLRFAVGVNKEF